MTPRQQEAHDLRAQGLTQTKIGELMSISQNRVSRLLDLNKTQYLGIARYRKTEAGKAAGRKQSARWAKANPDKVKAIGRRYYAANREKIAEKDARYLQTERGRETKRKSGLKYYRNNSEKMNAQNAAYQKTPSGRTAHNLAARKWAARKREQESGA